VAVFALPPVERPPVALPPVLPPVLLPPVAVAPPVALTLPPEPAGPGEDSELHANANSTKELETQPTRNRPATLIHGT
jgi:hypothetical protein